MKISKLIGGFLMAALLLAMSGACGSDDDDDDSGPALSPAEELRNRICAKTEECSPGMLCALPVFHDGCANLGAIETYIDGCANGPCSEWTACLASTPACQ